MSAAPAARRSLGRLGQALGALIFALAGAALAGDDFAVRYRSAETIYLDAGRLAGLAEGDQLDVLRAERIIGQIEVTYVADHSASCRLLREVVPIQEGDRARRLGDADAAENGSPAPTAAPGVEPASPLSTGEPAPKPVPAYPQPAARQAARKRSIRSSGAFSIDWEQFGDNGDAGADYQRIATRLSLRLRENGKPWEFRLRYRRRDITRDHALGATTPDSESQDRLYEASFSWRPQNGRFGLQLGRIGSSPFLGVGYLDGAIGEVRLARGFSLGALVGTRPELNDLGFASDGLKYGIFTRFTTHDPSGGEPFEMILGGIREEGREDVSREYVTLQTRWSSADRRFSIYQNSELDLNNGWRAEVSDQSTQLSNFTLSATLRLSEIGRMSLSYNRNERYRTEETRSLPDELFDSLLRQGVHATLWVGRPRGLTFTAHAGVRDREGDEERTTSYGLGLRHGNVAGWGLSLSGDVVGFSNPYSDGAIARLRAAKRLGERHELSLNLGGRFTDPVSGEADTTSSSWARLGFWSELAGGFFFNGEVEVTAGDEFEGRRVIIGLGYRL